MTPHCFSIFDELCIYPTTHSPISSSNAHCTAGVPPHTLFCSLTTPGGSLAPRTFKYEQLSHDRYRWGVVCLFVYVFVYMFVYIPIIPPHALVCLLTTTGGSLATQTFKYEQLNHGWNRWWVFCLFVLFVLFVFLLNYRSIGFVSFDFFFVSFCF